MGRCIGGKRYHDTLLLLLLLLLLSRRMVCLKKKNWNVRRFGLFSVGDPVVARDTEIRSHEGGKEPLFF